MDFECIRSRLSVKIVGLNVCGFNKKMQEGILEEYIKGFDLICLSETKTDDIEHSFMTGFEAV